jgi:TonB family protein
MMSPHHQLSRETKTIAGRTRKCNGLSACIHALLLLWLVLSSHVSPFEEGLTEITFIDSAEPLPPAVPLAVARSAPAPTTRIERQSRDIRDERFQRDAPVADIAPEPQELQRVEDRISERLASLQQKSADRPVNIAAELSRGDAATPEPIALSRDRRAVTRANIVPAPFQDAPVERARPKQTESDAKRVLADAQLTGPVADRPILSYGVPVYPEWAKEEAVEGSVAIYFVVLPDGRVKENVMVEKTAGFTDFDDNAVRALLNWRFAPLGTGATGEQWGTITFHYRLSDAR